jgi:hypothetical protein
VMLVVIVVVVAVMVVSWNDPFGELTTQVWARFEVSSFVLMKI